MLNRSKLVAAVLLIGAFVAGAVVGGAASAAWGAHERGASSESRRRTSYAERLQVELALSAGQRDSVNAILARREAQMEVIWREIRPRFDSLRAAIRGEIMALLLDEQRTRYQELIDRSDSLRALRRTKGGRHGKR